MTDPSTTTSTDTPIQARVLQSSAQGIEPSPFKVFQYFWKQELAIDKKYKTAIKEAEKKKADALIATGYYNIQDEIAAQGGYDIRMKFKEEVKEFDEKAAELEEKISDLQHYLDEMIGTKSRPGPLKQAEAFAKSRGKTNTEDNYTLQDIFDDQNILKDKNRETLEASGLINQDEENDEFLALLQKQKNNDPANILYLKQKNEFDRIQTHLNILKALREENTALREALKTQASEKLATLREKIVSEHQKVFHEASKELDNIVQARKDAVSELWDNGLPAVWKETKDAVKLDFYRSLGDAQYFAATIGGACSDFFKGLKNAISVMRTSLSEGHEKRQTIEFSGEKKRDAFLNERAAEQLKQDSNKLETPEGTATQEEPDALEPTA